MKTTFVCSRGVSLVEILVYIALLGVLISVTFSTAFMLGRDRDHLVSSAQQQVYDIAFMELVRNESQKTPDIYEPSLGGTSTKVQFKEHFLEPETSNQSRYSFNGHFFISPHNIIFSRSTTTLLIITGDFAIHPFELMVNTWPVR
ncbi:MAG: type II secretion system protein [Patescibacteria group bacterium]